MVDYSEFDNLAPDLMYFIHRKCTATWTIERSITDFVDLTYLVAGKAQYIVDGISYDVSAGDMIYIPFESDREAVTFADDLMECYCLNVYMNDLTGNSTELPFPVVSHIGINKDLIALHKELSAVCLRRMPGYRLAVRGLLLLIIQRYLGIIVYKSNVENMDIRIKKVIHAITEGYSENLLLDDFAKQFGLNKTYFGILFKQETGMSFHQYVTSIRMNIAEDLLRSGEYSVGDVSQKCGFSDTFYFSKVFKKNYGFSPSRVIGKESE